MKLLLYLLLLFTPIILPGQASIDEAKVDSINNQAFGLYGKDPYLMLDMGNNVLALSNKLNYKEGMANSYNIIALAHLSLSDYQEALKNFLNALRIYDELNNEANSAKILSNIGIVYFYLEDHQKSLDYYEKALAIGKKNNDNKLIAKSLNNIGIAYKNLGKYHEALGYYQEALGYKLNSNDSIGMSTTLNNIGSAYLYLANYNKALDYYQQSYDIDLKSNNTRGLTTSTNNIGLVNMKLGQYATAEKYFHKAIGLSKALDFKQSRLESYEYLNELSKLRNDYKSALNWSEQSIALSDSLNNSEKNRVISELEARYKNESVKAENELLKEKQLLNSERLLRQNILIYTGIVGLALLILLVIFLFRSYRLKRSLFKIEKLKNAEITKKNKLILDQKAELEQLNDAKNKMFSILSHDIKGPFNNLLSILSFAAEGQLSDEELKKLLKMLTAEANNVSELITNILEWVKTQMGGIALAKQRFRLKPIADEMVKLYGSLAAAKGVEIQNNIDREVLVLADENITKMIFRNLLSNAIKFTNEGTIELNSELEDGLIKISVKDSGIGIQKENFSKLFSKDHFTTTGTSNEMGTGIGLLLVKEFVLKNGGTLNMESTVGKGTTFTFTMAIAK